MYSVTRFEMIERIMDLFSVSNDVELLGVEELIASLCFCDVRVT